MLCLPSIEITGWLSGKEFLITNPHQFSPVSMMFFLLLLLPLCSSQQIDNTFTCPTPTGLFPDPKTCHYYYNCAHGVPYRYPCPAGTLYDASITNVSTCFTLKIIF